MIVKSLEDIDDYRCIVIYGNDVGKVLDSKNKILSKIMPNYKNDLGLIDITNTLNKIKSSAEEQENDGKSNNILINEFKSMSFFSNNKVITLDIPPEPNKNMSKIISDYIESLKILFSNEVKSNNTIIITSANNIDKSSAIRKLAESNKYCACLSIYQDSERDIKNIILEKLNKFKYDNDVVDYLCNCLIGDRMIIYSELEKLIMYKGDDKNLTIDDVKKVIFDNSIINEGDFVNSVANLDIDKVYIELNKLYSEGIYPIVLVRYLINYFLQLHLIKYKSKNGVDIETLLLSVFWKQKPIMREHIKKLSLENINYALELLLKEECKLKGAYII